MRATVGLREAVCREHSPWLVGDHELRTCLEGGDCLRCYSAGPEDPHIVPMDCFMASWSARPAWILPPSRVALTNVSDAGVKEFERRNPKCDLSVPSWSEAIKR